VPAATALAIIVAGGRWARQVAALGIVVGVGLALALAARVEIDQHAINYVLGGWQPPLGIALRADGLAATMVVLAAVIIAATALYAAPIFGPTTEGGETRASLTFWTCLMAIWSGLAIAFLSNDLFNLYVALELLTFAAVPLVSLDGRSQTLEAALRYLLFALAGSVLYLLGTAIIYGTSATLDIGLVAARGAGQTGLGWAVALMTAGLLAKTALFPLHLWLPRAHAGAPAAASAILSALVVKGSFLIVLRLWFDVLPAGPGLHAATMLGALGAAAILVGSAMALRQERLKLLIAYSTIAQIGYLFLVFPLATGTGATPPWASIAWTGGILQLLAHAFAKAGMFMAAGVAAETLGHDRIDGLGGLAGARPWTFAALAAAGLSLVGLPPSGGFSAKWLMLIASLDAGQWWWAAIILIGGLLAAGYIFRVIDCALRPGESKPKPAAPGTRLREGVALALALTAIGLGLMPLRSSAFLAIGRPLPQEVGLQ
jgi:formate hydrogenlyase subunit 3/multisubunit Na+/H+ antiporter MnhD subunit